MRGFIGNVIVLVSVITVASPYLHPALANSQPLTGNQLKLLLNGSMIEADGEDDGLHHPHKKYDG